MYTTFDKVGQFSMSWTTFRNKKFFYYFICCHFHRNFWPWKVCYRVLRSKIFGHAFVFPYSIWNIVNMQAVNVITSHCLMQCDFFSRFVNYNFFLRSRCCVCVCMFLFSAVFLLLIYFEHMNDFEIEFILLTFHIQRVVCLCKSCVFKAF